MTLADLYAEQCATPSDIYLHLPRFVEWVGELEAQQVIELGSRSGVSTIAWLYALDGTGGQLTSVDLDAAPEIGTWSHWRHIQGNDLDREIFDALPMADIVFIDTSHAYQQTLDELELYVDKVKPGGVILLHDTMLGFPEDAPSTDPRFPVRRAIDKFTADRGLTWTNIRENWGLGIVHL